MDEIPRRLDQHLIGRRLAQIGRKIPGEALRLATLHECRKSQAALDGAHCIEARRLYRSARQVYVRDGLVGWSTIDAFNRFQQPQPACLMGDDRLSKPRPLKRIIRAASRAK